MSEVIYMTYSLENIECGGVFTQMNSEKQILLLFFMQTYPDIPAMLGDVLMLGTFTLWGRKGKVWRD